MKASRNPGIVPLGIAAASPELFPTPQAQHRILASVARREGIEANRLRHGTGTVQKTASPDSAAIHRLGMQPVGRRPCDHSRVQDALNLCLRAVAGPGDVIPVESPTYFCC